MIVNHEKIKAFIESGRESARAIEDKLGQGKNAARSYRKFIELAPTKYAQQVDYARRRVNELERE